MGGLGLVDLLWHGVYGWSLGMAFWVSCAKSGKATAFSIDDSWLLGLLRGLMCIMIATSWGEAGGFYAGNRRRVISG